MKCFPSQVTELLKILSTAPPDGRTLVFVDTRAIARHLCAVLRCDADLRDRLQPTVVVGHGGYDGMDWEWGQEPALESFASGKSRLLVCTSVLEEGLDVASCDLVVRFQGASSLISLIQSRGRARKRGSRVVVILSEATKHRADQLQSQENLMEGMLQMQALGEDRVPSLITKQRIDLLQGPKDMQEGCANKGDGGDRPREGELLSGGQKAALRLFTVGAQKKAQADQLEEAVIDALEKSPLGLSVQLVVALQQGASVASATAGVFTACDSAVVVGVKSRAGLGGGTMPQYQAFCEGWDFRISLGGDATVVWVQPATKRAGGLSPEKRPPPLPVARAVVGSFDGPHEFVEAFVATTAPGVDGCLTNLTFTQEGGVELCLPDAWGPCPNSRKQLRVKVDHSLLDSFALINWSRSPREATLYLPLRATPLLFAEDFEGKETRLCGCQTREGQHPLLRALASSFVLAVVLPGECLPEQFGEWGSLRAFLQDSDVLPVPVFSSRVVHLKRAQPQGCSFLDSLWSMQQSPSCPSLGLDSLYWALGVLETSCTAFPASSLAAIRDECVSFIHENGALPQVVEAAVEAVYEAKGTLADNGYWATGEAIARFKASLSLWIQRRGVSRECVHGSRLPPGHVLLERAAVTPSRVVLLPPAPAKSSRLLRSFPDRRFVVVHFCEEQMQKLRGTDTLPGVKAILQAGIQVGGRLLRYFGSSASQLREHGAMFVMAESSCEVQGLRDSIILNGKSFLSAASYGARLGLFMTADTPACDLDPKDVWCAEDLRAADSGELLTDGAGKIAPDLAASVAARLGLGSKVPSAFQFRWGGLKGILLVAGEDDPEFLQASAARQGVPCKMLCRPSMRKFESDSREFCVVSYATHRQVSLNREIITLLTSLSPAHEWDPEHRRAGQAASWSPAETLIRRQEEALTSAAAMLTDEHRAAQELMGRGLPQLWRGLLLPSAGAGANSLGGEQLLTDPFWLSLLGRACRMRTHALATKSAVPIPPEEGALLLGVPEPVAGTLREGEVFVQVEYERVSNSASTTQRRVVVGDVLVYRNPCLHPGDIQRLRAVDCPQLRGLKNVLVLPCSGTRSVAACCSGGDLDGDLFSVLWAADIVPPAQLMQPPLDYDALLREAKSSAATTGLREDPADLFCRVLYNDALGKIAHIHLALCDMLPLGALDPLAQELAKSQSIAVDFPKTGVQPKVPSAAQELVRESGFPDFMRKPPKISYPSSKALGIMYRQAVSLDSELELLCLPTLEGQEGGPDDLLLLPGRDAWRQEALEAQNDYARDLARLLRRHGLRCEAEAALGAALHWEPSVSDHGRAAEAIQADFSTLLEHHRSLFFQGLTGTDDPRSLGKASAWYDVSYGSVLGHDSGKRQPQSFRSFAWVVGDLLCRIRRSTTSVDEGMDAGLAEGPGDEPSGLAACEAIGRSGLCLLRNLLPAVQRSVRNKLAGQACIQRGLDAQGAAFQVHVHGSVALLLCEEESDLDISLLAKDAALQPSREEAKYFLEKFVLPVLDGLVAVGQKPSALLDAHVPVVRAVLPSPLDTGEASELRVDITVGSDGLEKAQRLRRWIHSRQGAEPFGALLLLTAWARAVGIIRSNSAAACPDEALMSTGEWQALVLKTVQMHDEGRGGDPLLRWALKQAPATKQDGGHPSPRKLEELLQSLSNRLLNGNQRDLRCLGACLLGFLRSISSMQQQGGAAAQGDAAETLAMVARVARHAARAVSVSHSFQAAEACGNDRRSGQRSVSLRLSHAMSYRLGGHTTFHELHLCTVSGGAMVKLVEVEGGKLLLSATGTPLQLQALRGELRRYTSAVRSIGLPSTRASRYFVEGSSHLFFEGAASPQTRVRFVRFMGDHIPIHAAYERMTPQPTATELGDSWRDFAAARFLQLWAQQVAKMPLSSDQSPGFLEILEMKVGFGGFYVLDVSSKLPDTCPTMFVTDLEEAIAKRKRSRKGFLQRLEAQPRGDQDSEQGSEKVVLRPCQSSVEPKATSARPAKKRCRQSSAGFGCSFCPGLQGHPLASRKALYLAALDSLGFQQVQVTLVPGSWVVKYVISSTLELDLRLSPDLAITEVKERSLCWVSGVVVGSRAADGTGTGQLDLNLRLASTQLVAEGSELREAVPDRVIELQGGVPTPVSPARGSHARARVLYARRLDGALSLTRGCSCSRSSPHCSALRAQVTWGVDFSGGRLQIQRGFCDLFVVPDVEPLRNALSGSNGSREASEAFAGCVWRSAMCVYDAVKSCASRQDSSSK